MTVSEANLACLQCGKPLTGNQTKYCCRECKGKYFYAVNQEQQRADARERMAKLRAEDPEKQVREAREWKRRNTDKTRLYRQRAIAKGLGVDVDSYARQKHLKAQDRGPCYSKMNAHAKQNARQAWVYWLRVKAPMGWLARYWKAEGRPWKNLRIKPAARVRIRRRLDEEFRQNEILRSGHKKALKKGRSDGTVSAAPLLRERKTCPYCAVKLTKKNVALDHIIPLAKGGAHSASNIVACCRPCNMKKLAKEFVVWVQCLEPQHRKRAEDMYLKKMGAIPEQEAMKLW